MQLLSPLAGILFLEAFLGQIPFTLAGARLTNFVPAYATNGDEECTVQCPILTPRFKSVLWLVHEDHVLIGASIEYDHRKYRYMASTGHLLIKNVTFFDAGVYRCIVTMGDGLDNVNQITSAVELIVNRNYENYWDDEFKENIIRGSIAGGILMGVLLSIYLIYKLRYKPPAYKLYSSHSLDLGVSGRHLDRRSTEGCTRGTGLGGSNAPKTNDIEETPPKSLAPSEVRSQPVTAVIESEPEAVKAVRGDILVGPPERRDSRRDSNLSFLRRLSIQTFNSLNASRRASEAEVGIPSRLDLDALADVQENKITSTEETPTGQAGVSKSQHRHGSTTVYLNKEND